MTFLLVVGVEYLNFKHVDSIMGYLSSHFMFAVSQRYLVEHYVTIGAAYVALSVPFILLVLQMLMMMCSTSRMVSPVIQGEHRPSKRKSRARGIIDRVLQAISITGPHFMAYILFVETFQLLLLTVQAVRASLFISNRTFNQLYGVVIVCKCWCTPLIHHFCGGHRPKVRLIRIVVDLVLDFMWGTLMQGYLFWQYYQYYLGAPITCGAENADRELRYFLVVSTKNFVLSAFPFVTSSITTKRVMVALTDISNPTLQTDMGGIVVEVKPANAHNTIASEHARPLSRHQRVAESYQWAMMTYGAAVFVVSMLSTGQFGSLSAEAELFPCQDQLYPWFTTKLTCVGRHVNCAKLNISGRRHELAAALDMLDPYELVHLAFLNCPELEIPATLLKFPAIMTLALYNATLMSWSVDAPIAANTFTQLQTLALIHVNVSCIPHGITDQPFPETFEWIMFDHVNAQDFLDSVVDKWNSTSYFYCTFCGLDKFPLAIKNMHSVQEVMLTHNAISIVADNAIAVQEARRLLYVELHYNPLLELPNVLVDLFGQLLYIDIQFTNVTELPTRVRDTTFDYLTVYAGGTQLCQPPTVLPAWVSCDVFVDGWWFNV